MNPPGKIQLQAPNIEEDIYKPEEHETFNGESGDAHLAKWREFVSSGAISTSSSHIKPHSESKAKIIQVHGGRIIRSSGRKDKHSKVCTMRGPKDRRLRLSPKTAIEFYDVQDRLGYDRASKAIDWLMKEAKSAIDALDEQPFLSSNMHTVAEINHSPPIVKTLEITKGTDSSVPGFGFFANETATSSSTDHFQACPDSYQDDFLSPLTATHQQIFDTNLETARIQRVFTYANPNSRGGAGFTNSIPPHLPGPSPGFGYSQMFTQREPLQSSINYYSSISTQFPGISFSNEEFSAFNAAQSLKEEENTAAFLHYED